PFLEFLNIPDPLIEAHLASRTASIGMTTTGLIERALLSLELFTDGEEKDVGALREKVRATARPYVRFHPEALPECFFHHLVDPLYGSRFYSYLWSQMLASACFDHIVGMLDLQAYRVFCDEVLSKGGGVDPSVLLRQFLGGEPTLRSFAELFR
ncbi:MAG: hypothetical protein KDK48_01265, partial [Chlamydiia bacterium]|nr:hypothetical protein [Chlamydiia bacterium]